MTGRKPIRLQLAPFRLRFKRPFGTAHGTRDGTDAVFLRLEALGIVGFGEATMPPYVAIDQFGVHGELSSPDIEDIACHWLDGFPKAFADPDPPLSAPARAALVMACHEVLARQAGCTVATLLGVKGNSDRPPAMITWGMDGEIDPAEALVGLPQAPVVKVKLGDARDVERLRALMAVDVRPVFLDANQGWKSLEQALAVISAVPIDRIVGVEQPFPVDRPDLAKALGRATGLTIYADESVQDLTDLEHAREYFGGVNVKLMKCGGLDRALAMVRESKRLGKRVMLGCMSESSLGCAAMAQLQPLADLVDLDGPWLVGNDPFSGLALDHDGFHIGPGPGYGVHNPEQLELGPIGA